MSLRQICGDERSRGAFIQEGGFKICCEANTKDSESPTARREAAHAVAKSLVTTNPHVLSEHQRLGAMRPLLYLCKYVLNGGHSLRASVVDIRCLWNTGNPAHLSSSNLKRCSL